MIIHDGQGSGRTAGVDRDGRVKVSSRISPRAFYASRDAESAFSYTSEVLATVSNTYVLSFRNRGTRLFVVDVIRVGASGAGGVFSVHKVTGGTPAGTSMPGLNLNLTSDLTGETFGGESFGNAPVTGITAASRLTLTRVPGGGTEHLEFDEALIIGANTTLAVQYTGAGNPDTICVLRGFFEDR